MGYAQSGTLGCPGMRVASDVMGRFTCVTSPVTRRAPGTATSSQWNTGGRAATGTGRYALSRWDPDRSTARPMPQRSGQVLRGRPGVSSTRRSGRRDQSDSRRLMGRATSSIHRRQPQRRHRPTLPVRGPGARLVRGLRCCVDFPSDIEETLPVGRVSSASVGVGAAANIAAIPGSSQTRGLNGAASAGLGYSMSMVTPARTSARVARSLNRSLGVTRAERGPGAMPRAEVESRGMPNRVEVGNSEKFGDPVGPGTGPARAMRSRPARTGRRAERARSRAEWRPHRVVLGVPHRTAGSPTPIGSVRPAAWRRPTR